MQPGLSVHVIDSDESSRRSLAALFAKAAMPVRTYVSATVFLGAPPPDENACIVADLDLRDGSGLDLLSELERRQRHVPVILTSSRATVPLAVAAMRAGASDFLEKPLDETSLLAAVRAAHERHCADSRDTGERAAILAHLESLSARERQVLDGLVAGQPNKIIAYNLGISIRTIELYRANVMAKMDASSLSDLIRMAMIGGLSVAHRQAS